MFSRQTYRDTQPFMHIGRMPVYVTTILVILTAVTTVSVFLMQSAGVHYSFLFFNPASFWKEGKVWQLFTHLFINQLSFFFLFSLVCIWWTGNGIETHLGRRSMLRLVLLMAIFPALVCTALWLVSGRPVETGGVITLTSGLIIAYATLYPNLEFWGWIPMKWMAFICMACAAIQYFPSRDWLGLTIFLSMCASTHFFTRYEMGHWSLPRFAFPSLSFKKRPKLRVMPKAEMLDDTFDPPVDPDLDDEVNRILDKIAKSGIASLDPKEQEVLQRAREALLKKEHH